MRYLRRKVKRSVAVVVAFCILFFVGSNIINLGTEQNSKRVVKYFEKETKLEKLSFVWFDAVNISKKLHEKTIDQFAFSTRKSTVETTTKNHKRLNFIAEKKVERVTRKNESYGELSCEEIQKLLTEALLSNKSELRKENDFGNRGIYFLSIEKKDGEVVHLVLKVASLPEPEYRLQSHLYRYRTAIKEIKILLELQRLKWMGIPQLYGACVTPSKAIYVVSRVFGRPLCKGLGLNMGCAVARDLTEYIEATPDPGLSTLTFLSKVTCFFEQFEKYHVFMEDISGTNIFFDEKTFDIYIVDADSLIFYGDIPLNSRTSCKNNDDCPTFKGNFWKPMSLNSKIYSLCREMNGDCKNNICRGVDSSLHTCGIAKWLVMSMKFSVPKTSYDAYKKLLHCMMLSDSRQRCSLKSACQAFTNELEQFQVNRLATPKLATTNQTHNIETIR